jgi:hypothetical protein
MLIILTDNIGEMKIAKDIKPMVRGDNNNVTIVCSRCSLGLNSKRGNIGGKGHDEEYELRQRSQDIRFGQSHYGNH